MMTAEITGVAELDERLLKVGSGIGRVTKRAIFAGLGPLVNRMRQLAPVNRRRWRSKKAKPGLLRKSIARRIKRDKKANVSTGVAGINVGRKSASHLRAPHGHLVALGTRGRKTKKGKNRGVMPKNDFVKRAQQSAEGAAVAAMKSAVNEGIEKELAKKGRR